MAQKEQWRQHLALVAAASLVAGEVAFDLIFGHRDLEVEVFDFHKRSVAGIEVKAKVQLDSCLNEIEASSIGFRIPKVCIHLTLAVVDYLEPSFVRLKPNMDFDLMLYSIHLIEYLLQTDLRYCLA